MLNVYDPNHNLIAIVDVYESLIWTERFGTTGDFEIVVAYDANKPKWYMLENYVSLSKKPWYKMVIESYEVAANEEEGNRVTVRGRTLDSLLERRIVWNQTVLQTDVQNAVGRLLIDNVIQPQDPVRTIPNFHHKRTNDPEIIKLRTEQQFTGDNLYAAVSELCANHNLDFFVTNPNGLNQMFFEMRLGVDRTRASDNPPVLFASDLGNLRGSKIYKSTEGLATVCLVAGEGEGDKRKRTTATFIYPEGTGVQRREIYKDARDVRSTRKGPNNTDVTIPETEYLAILKKRGEYDLYEHRIQELMDGESSDSIYEYGEDYFLGDIVEIETPFGEIIKARITEYIISHSEGEFAAYPTFEIIR